MTLLEKLTNLKHLQESIHEENHTEVMINIIKLEREIVYDLVDIGFTDKQIAKIINNKKII